MHQAHTANVHQYYFQSMEIETSFNANSNNISKQGITEDKWTLFGLKYWAFTKAFLPEAEGCLSVYLEEKEV